MLDVLLCQRHKLNLETLSSKPGHHGRRFTTVANTLRVDNTTYCNEPTDEGTPANKDMTKDSNQKKQKPTATTSS